jgi:septum formation protein
MRLILASQSPRRRLLLRQHGVDHDAIHPGVDDALLEPGELATAAQWAAALAYLKARAAAEALGDGEQQIVIGADTVVVKGDELIGQPRDAADAQRIIHLLQDGWHTVVTGVALVFTGQAGKDAVGRPRRDLFVDRATVHIGHIGDRRIAEYIASGLWQGKAGAYNLSERLEAGWPVDFDGDAGTIMGLPVGKLVARLATLDHT